VNTVRERLDKIQKAERRQIIAAAIVAAVLLAIAALFYFVFHVPGKAREVTGAIVSFETRTSDDATRVAHFVHVRLDDGPTVRAAIDAHVPIKVGRRAILIATKMPILGIERYRFKGFVDEPSDVNDLFQK
jgi:hypothetical protein